MSLTSLSIMSKVSSLSPGNINLKLLFLRFPFFLILFDRFCLMFFFLIFTIFRSQLTNGSLYINSVVEEQRLTGTYQCMATLPQGGSIVSRTAKLSIASKFYFYQFSNRFNGLFSSFIKTNLPIFIFKA